KDGLDIAVHVGGDHDEPPQDINHARSIYDDLLATGFKSAVEKFEELKIDSGPMTRTINVRGSAVSVRVRIVHVDMSTPDARRTRATQTSCTRIRRRTRTTPTSSPPGTFRPSSPRPARSSRSSTLSSTNALERGCRALGTACSGA